MSIITRYMRNFFKDESASGILMLLGALFGFIAANTEFFSYYYNKIIETEFALQYGPLGMSAPMSLWINEVFMAFFFLLIAMELKREIFIGGVLNRRQLWLCVMGALGGIVGPTLIFTLFNYADPVKMHGWAIPTATDTAFALCILVLVGKAAPLSLKIFLLAMTIFDDLGAIIIVAAFYSRGINMPYLWMGAVVALVMWWCHHRRVGSQYVYIALMFALWWCFHHTGIHATVAGAVTAAFIPVKDRDNRSFLNNSITDLHHWVGFIVLPLFAFVNAGFDLRNFTLAWMAEPLTLGIIGGLFVGKQAGIMGFCWLGVKILRLPLSEGLNWLHMYAVSVISGIGFTMSILIGKLTGFDGVLASEFKMGIITGSVLSALWGYFVLVYGSRFFNRRNAALDENTDAVLSEKMT